MNSYERVMAAVGLKPVDRTPVLPVMLQQGARVLNVPLSQYFKAPRQLVLGQNKLLERFDHDGVFAFPHVVQDTLAWGAGLNFHDDGPPSVNKMVIHDFADILKLPKADPTANPYMRHTLDAAEALAKEHKGKKLIVGGLIGPISLPTLLMGTGKFMRLLLEPELRQQYYRPLMDRMMEYTVRWAKAQLAAGCDLVVMAEGIASATILTEKTFVAEAKPVIKTFLERVGGPVGLEMVGDALPFMRHLRDLPAALLLIGSNDDVSQCRKVLGRQKALMGNINNLKLLRWDPERVEFEARRAIFEAGPGFILANQGPDIPWQVTDAAIAAMVRATRRQVSHAGAPV